MIYAFAYMNTADPETLAAYRKQAADALARHGGKVVAFAADPTVLEGDLPAPDSAVIFCFPDRDAALAWIGDPALQEIHALRRKGAQSTIFLLG